MFERMVSREAQKRKRYYREFRRDDGWKRLQVIELRHEQAWIEVERSGLAPNRVVYAV